MMEFIHGVGSFLTWIVGISQGVLLMVLLGVLIMVAFAVLGLVARRGAKSAAREAFNLKLVKINDDLTFQTRPAIATLTPTKTAAKPRIAADKVTVVLKFEGDTMATGRQDFARMVDEVLVNKERVRRVIVVVNSPGGGVSHYGQMYAEMERLRNAGLDVTACVDTYAASGGYLMSVPAHRIVAAPFAMVGSIGVVSEFMNFNKLLKNLGVEPLTLTAGELKRTVTPLSEVTEDGKNAYKKQLEAIHRQFIAVVKKYRNVDETNVCTGNHWTAAESVELKLNLVDEIATSQEYLFQANQEEDLVYISKPVSPYQNNILGLARRFVNMIADTVIERLSSRV